MAGFSDEWAEAVCAVCDPVFDAAGVDFEPQVIHDAPDGPVTALLWEADARLFAERYPDSGIAETYGKKWAGVSRLDYWVHLSSDPAEGRISIEGWDLPEETVRLTGDGTRDGVALGQVFARILRVPAPTA
jgi:hypothetical protein